MDRNFLTNFEEAMIYKTMKLSPQLDFMFPAGDQSWIPLCLELKYFNEL